MKVVIRKKEFRDIRRCEEVITLAWQETYKGIVEDNFLKHLEENLEERVIKREEEFYNDNDKRFVLEVDGLIVGILRVGQCQIENYLDSGELYALYILKQYHGLGLGRKLVDKAKSVLKEDGYKTMLIGCLDKNPTNEFYKHLGGKFITTGIFKAGSQEIKENYYYFKI